MSPEMIWEPQEPSSGTFWEGQREIVLREFLFKQPDIMEAWGNIRAQDSEAEQDKEGGGCKEDTEEVTKGPPAAGGEDAGQARVVCACNRRWLRPEARGPEQREHRRLCSLV